MKLAAFLLGAIGLSAQVVLFREALVRAGGDELSLGALLGSWLAAGAIGAGLARWPRRRSGPSAGVGLLLLFAALAESLEDQRVMITARGTRRRLDGERQYDVIWLGGVDPDRAGPAQLVTVEGFERIAASLAPAGLVGLRLGAVDGVEGSLGMRQARLVAAGMADAGLEPVLLADGTLLGSRGEVAWCLLPGRLAARAAERSLAASLERSAAWTEVFDPLVIQGSNLLLRGHEGSFDPLAFLGAGAVVEPSRWPPFEPGVRHTDRRPLARSLGARIRELHARGGAPDLLAALSAVGPLGQGLLALLFLGALSLAARAGCSPSSPLAGARLGFRIATTSFVATVGLLLVLEHYQARMGALYADLGWLGGAFLVAFSVGSCSAERLRRWVPVELAAIAILGGIGVWILSPAIPAVFGATGAALGLGGVAGAAVGGGARIRGVRWAWALDLSAAAPGAFLAGLALLTGRWAGCLGVLLALETAALLVRIGQSRASRGTPPGEDVIGSRDPLNS